MTDQTLTLDPLVDRQEPYENRNRVCVGLLSHVPGLARNRGQRFRCVAEAICKVADGAETTGWR